MNEETRIQASKVNSKKQTRIPEEILEQLEVGTDDMIEYHENPETGYIVLKGVPL